MLPGGIQSWQIQLVPEVRNETGGVAMKSIKAQEYLNGTSMHPNSPLAKDQQFVWRDYSIIKAVEIAEADRDAKAVKAHRECCPRRDNDVNKCLFHGVQCFDHCDYMKDFTRKLNEE